MLQFAGSSGRCQSALFGLGLMIILGPDKSDLTMLKPDQARPNPKYVKNVFFFFLI